MTFTVVLGRVSQEHEDLVGRQRDAVLGVHLGVELLSHAGVELEHAAPGGEFVLGEKGGRRRVLHIVGLGGAEAGAGWRRAGDAQERGYACLTAEMSN